MKHFRIRFEVHSAAGECLCKAIYIKLATSSMEATAMAIRDLHRLGVVRQGEQLSMTTELDEPTTEVTRWAEARGYNPETAWRN